MEDHRDFSCVSPWGHLGRGGGHPLLQLYNAGGGVPPLYHRLLQNNPIRTVTDDSDVIVHSPNHGLDVGDEIQLILPTSPVNKVV